MKRYTLKQFYKEKLNKIYCCDSLTALKAMPNESIDMIITSPPYWSLRDYGEDTKIIWDGDTNCKHQWENKIPPRGNKSGKHCPNSTIGAKIGQDGARRGSGNSFCSKCAAWYGSLGLEPTFDLYIKHLCDIFDEAKLALKKTGTIWINLGDTYSQSGKGAWKNKNSQKEVYVPDKKPKIKETLPAKCLVSIPARFQLEMINRGWILRNIIIWQKPNAMPSSCRDRFTVDFEYLFFFSKNKKYYFERQFESYKGPMNRWGGEKLKADGKSTWDKGTGQVTYRDRSMRPNKQGRNKRCVWSIPTKPFKGAHFAVFPTNLLETPIKAGCPEFVCKKCGKARVRIVETKSHYTKRENAYVPNSEPTKVDSTGWEKPTTTFIGWTACGCNTGFRGGVVLDPFIGAGTTALVARKLGRNFIGLELNPDYIKIANKRLKETDEQATR